MLQRSLAKELSEAPDFSDVALDRFHNELTRIHRYLGDTRAVAHALRRNPFPLRTLLDVGCGRGQLLLEMKRRLNIEVVGVEIRAPKERPAVPIIGADATRDRLPNCDVAIAVCVAHHLTENELVQLVRNVGRSCRRFILLDPVRHRLPLYLFRTFVYPFLHPITAADGICSLRRSFTCEELRGLVGKALEGSEARFRHTVAPLYVRQCIDILYY